MGSRKVSLKELGLMLGKASKPRIDDGEKHHWEKFGEAHG